MKKLIWTAAIALNFAFVACSDDSGTSANDNDESSLSSASLSSSATTEDLASSSSVLSSSEEESSLSSAEVNSSSSDTKKSSSSSSAKSSSSTAKSSSSSKDPEPAEGSSSSSLSSSSSEDSGSSSSSEYVPFDHKDFLASELTVGKDRYSQFTDERNGRSYYYITITGKDTSGKANTVTVMAENLNIGDMVKGSKDQKDDSKIERYCYSNDTTYCDKYGGLYQWSEMMALPNKCNTESCADSIKPNHQGICPNGWRLLTYNDIYTIIRADGNDEGLAGIRSTYQFGGFNTTGYSLVGAGYNWDYGFKNVKTSTYWYYPAEIDDVKAKSSFSGSYSTILERADVLKTQGFSVRCVMVENP